MAVGKGDPSLPVEIHPQYRPGALNSTFRCDTAPRFRTECYGPPGVGHESLMKFVHTADWQIGMRARHVGEAGIRVREARLQSARTLLDLARERGADFVLLAGDTFEDNGVDRILVQKVADLLGRSGLPVYLIAGNHDPLIPGSVWDHPVWKSWENLHVVREEQPVSIPGGMLYPCPARAKHSERDPTEWIRRERIATDQICIGLAHGTVDAVHLEEPEFPIPRDVIQRSGLDYLALGHWHSTVKYTGDDGSVRMAYSGTHETTRFAERDSGNALWVEIDSRMQSPRVTGFRTGVLDWLALDREIRDGNDLESVRKSIETLQHPERTLLRLKLSGFLPPDAQDQLLHLTEVLASRFLHGRIDPTALRPPPEYTAWLSRIPSGVIREAAESLHAMADPGYSGTRPEGATPDVAMVAIMELLELLDGEDSP
jgi:DNA repair exonuclease SbcCD nuclease subunit